MQRCFVGRPRILLLGLILLICFYVIVANLLFVLFVFCWRAWFLVICFYFGCANPRCCVFTLFVCCGFVGANWFWAFGSISLLCVCVVGAVWFCGFALVLLLWGCFVDVPVFC